MNKIDKAVIYVTLVIFLLSTAYLRVKVRTLENDNAYMVEQVKKLDENVLVIEDVLEDQHKINDELSNRLGNYADNIKAVNELLAKLKGE